MHKISKLALRLRPTPIFTHPLTRTLHTSPPSHNGDPWGPMPHTQHHIDKTTSPADAPPPQRLPRPNEPLEKLRARLVYQARKRGTLESDLLLSTFAAERLGEMGEEELKEFDRLMDEPDWDIYYWATEKKTPPQRWVNSELLQRLKVHVKNEGKVVRRMPDLH